jgi:hypothetical protein
MRFKAAIVETRDKEDFVGIIKEKHLKYLPEKYELHVFVGEKNKHLVEGVDFGRVAEITVLGRKIRSLDDYNRLLMDRGFWTGLECDKVLIFQADSGLLRTGIEEFEEYDWVGAPWPDSGWSKGEPWVRCSNGGLSLRSVDKMIEVLDRVPIEPINEDGYFSHGLLRIGGKVAPREVGMMFCVEQCFGLGSLGYHGIEKWFDKGEVNAILNQYEDGAEQG